MKKLTIILFIIGTTSFYVPKKISWVAIGDSITYINEHFEPTEYRITKGYLTLVIEKMPQISYDNQGYSSLGATNIAHSIEKFPFKKADLYTIFLGTNDWAHSDLLGTLSDYINSTGDNTFFGAYRIIINKLRSLNKDARIVLITPMQRGDFVWLESKKVNTWGSYREKNGQLLSQFAEAVNKIGQYEHLETGCKDKCGNLKNRNRSVILISKRKAPSSRILINCENERSIINSSPTVTRLSLE